MTGVQFNQLRMRQAETALQSRRSPQTQASHEEVQAAGPDEATANRASRSPLRVAKRAAPPAQLPKSYVRCHKTAIARKVMQMMKRSRMCAPMAAVLLTAAFAGLAAAQKLVDRRC